MQLNGPLDKHRSRLLIAAAVAGSTTVAVFLAVSMGWLPKLFSAALLLGLLALAPTAEMLVQRLTFNGALFLGLAPVLWWVLWPVHVNHGALVLGVGWGVVVYTAVRSTESGATGRRLVPRVATIDLALVVGGGLAVAAVGPWAFANTPRRALGALLPGADNYAHFGMFAGIKANGATLDVLPQAADGSGRAFDDYPQSFHAVVATITDVTNPGAEHGVALLPAYALGVACLVILATVVLTSAVLCLPRLRARPAVAFPVLAVGWVAFLWEPGQKVLADGFANFWLGAIAGASALTISASARGFLPRRETAAVASLCVVMAHTWTPLLVIGGCSVLGLLVGVRDRRGRDGDGHAWLLSVGVLTLGGLMIAKGVLLVASHDVGTMVTKMTGGMHGTSPVPTFLLTIMGLYACAAGPALARGRGVGDDEMNALVRARALVAAPGLGLVVLSVIFVVQLRTMGTTAYYFLKYLTGFELILAGFVPAICGQLVATMMGPSRRRLLSTGTTAVAVLLVPICFVGVSPGVPLLYNTTGEGTAQVGPPLSRTGMVNGILRVAAGNTSDRFLERDYLPLGRGETPQAFYADAWAHGITNSLSWRVFSRYQILRVDVADVEEAAPLVRTMLGAEPGLEIVVDPDFLSSLRQALGDPRLARRVVSW